MGPEASGAEMEPRAGEGESPSDGRGGASTLEEFTQPVARTADEAHAFALADDTWSLVLPLAYPGIRSVNAYLLALSDGLALVDCGSALDPGWDALGHAIAQTGHAIGDISLLVCTHLHMDHAGLAHALAEHTGCRLARGVGPAIGHDAFRDRWVAVDRRRRRAVGEGVPTSEVTTLVGPLIGGDGGRSPQPTFDRLLRHGERLQAAAGDWEVIAAPGHACTQILLWQARRRWLISADLVLPFALLEYGSLPDPVALQRDSLRRAAALGAERMLPGHGRPIQPSRAVHEQIAGARRDLDALIERARTALAGGQCSGYELSELLDPGNHNLEWRQAALSLSMCLLEHLVLSGQAHAVTGDDGVRRFAATTGVTGDEPSRPTGSPRPLDAPDAR